MLPLTGLAAENRTANLIKFMEKEMFKSLFVSVILMFVMIGSANATLIYTPYRLVGMMFVLDERNIQTEAIGINVPAENLEVCNTMKTAIMATPFSGGNYYYVANMKRSYSLTCVNTTIN